MSILSLVAKLGLDKSGFDAGMAAAGRSVDKFGGEMKSKLAAGFGAVAVGVAIKNAIEFADRIQDISEQLDVGVEALQGYEYAASQSGTSLDAMAGALKKIVVARREALGDTSGEFAKSFENLGVSIDDLKSKRLEDLLDLISERFRQAGDNQELLADGIKILGKSAQETFGALKAGLSDLKQQAADNGLIVSPEVIESVARYKDQWVELGSKLRTVSTYAAYGIAAAHNGLAEFFDEILGKGALVMRFLIGGTQDKLSLQELLQEEQMRKNAYSFDRKGAFGVGYVPGLGSIRESDIGIKQRERDAHMAEQELILEDEALKKLKERALILNQLKSTPDQNVKDAAARLEALNRAVKFRIDPANNREQLEIVNAEIDLENAKGKVPKKSQRDFHLQDTAFGRIGAFTGAATSAAMPAIMHQQIRELQMIREVLAMKGIIVRESN